jgi:acetyl-CoA carboxylase biotin carboxyl carrier protein
LLIWFQTAKQSERQQKHYSINIIRYKEEYTMSQQNAEGLVEVIASVNSVFYSRPSPGEPTFVAEGDQVEADTVVCLLEIMKCFRSVPAGVKGTVEKVVVESGVMVKKGQPVMLIRPEK